MRRVHSIASRINLGTMVSAGLGGTVSPLTQVQSRALVEVKGI